MNIGIIGGFSDSMDGQTIKTKELERSIKKQDEKLNINKLNGAKYKSFYKFLFLPFDIFRMLLKSDVVIIILSSRGFKITLPIIMFYNFFLKRKIYDFVIGGNRHNILKKNYFLRLINKNISKSYVELPDMVSAYKTLGINNCECIPNFKNLKKTRLNISKLKKEPPYKLCVFSRISKEKGVEDAINAVIKINEKYNKEIYKLDLYGQVDEGYKIYFAKYQTNLPAYICYKGIVEASKSTSVLENYDALLFPTFWQGEGFPGTIIDAFFSGLPVIASDWNYNSQIIKNGKTGKIFKPNDVSEIVKILDFYANNIDELHNMRFDCLEEADKYLPENALKPFFDELNKIMNESILINR